VKTIYLELGLVAALTVVTLACSSEDGSNDSGNAGTISMVDRAIGGSAGTGGDLGSGGTGTAGDDATGGASTGEPRTMGFVGCSMSVNVAQGYQTLGGERLWPPVQAYNGMVVQNWANTNDNVWSAFEDQVNTYGTPDSVWVMLCIFSNQITYQETTQIIGNVRERAPNATIHITGQPLYEEGLSCSLAGVGGPELTDDMAQQAGNDASQNVNYGGIFGPLTAAHTAGDATGCHANNDGQAFLGQQAIDKWGE